MKEILVIGSTNIDYVIRVKHMAVAGETIMGRGFEKNFGGKGANQAYACGKLGGSVSFVSAVGNDELGAQAIENLRSVNVRSENTRISEGVPTGMALICVNEEGDNSIVLVPGANDTCEEEWIMGHVEAIARADILMLQLETPLAGVWSAIHEGSRLGKTIVLDPAPVPEAGLPESIYGCVTYLTPNEAELRALTGMSVDTEEQICAAAKELVRRGAKNVIVTMGKKGALLMNAQGVRTYPPCPVSPIDTTAAGDTFNAALAVQLSKPGANIDRAIAYANAAAAISTTRNGAQPSIPSAEEVEAYIASNMMGEIGA